MQLSFCIPAYIRRSLLKLALFVEKLEFERANISQRDVKITELRINMRKRRGVLSRRFD